MVSREEFRITDLINYLKNPEYVTQNNYSLLSNIKYLIWSYFSCLLFIVFTTIILTFVDKFLVLIFDIESVQQKFIFSIHSIKHSLGSYSFFIFALVGPLVEETIFRLPLNLKKINIGLAIAILVFRFSGNSLINTKLYNLHYFIFLFFCVITIPGISLLIPNSIINKIKFRYFSMYFYLIAVTFSLVHIANLHSLNFNLILIYPVFVLPQLVSGLFIANNRMQRGFVWGFLLHALINSTSFLFQ